MPTIRWNCLIQNQVRIFKLYSRAKYLYMIDFLIFMMSSWYIPCYVYPFDTILILLLLFAPVWILWNSHVYHVSRHALKLSLPNPLKPGVQVKDEDVVWAAPTGDAQTTSEWSKILLPTKVHFILKVWRYILSFQADTIIYRCPNLTIILLVHVGTWHKKTR